MVTGRIGALGTVVQPIEITGARRSVSDQGRVIAAADRLQADVAVAIAQEMNADTPCLGRPHQKPRPAVGQRRGPELPIDHGNRLQARGLRLEGWDGAPTGELRGWPPIGPLSGRAGFPSDL